jgi:hypothetical protein
LNTERAHGDNERWSRATRVGAVTAALAVLALSACITVGRNFVRPDPSTITLKKTTRSEIEARLGPPFSTGQFSKNGQLIDSMHYFYGKQDAIINVIHKKHCWFYFVGPDLVGFVYLTGLSSEQRDFDAQLVRWIVKGKTTKAEVMTMLGPPAGVLQYPVTDEKKTVEGDSSIIYSYHAKQADKFLEVFFDVKGVAKDVNLEVSQKGSNAARAYGGGAD